MHTQALGGVVKAGIIVIVIAGVLIFKLFSRQGEDFQACHSQAMDIVQLWERTSHYPPDVEHDQIDEYLHVCMLGKGYSYNPSAWERCPTEKINTCYGLTISSVFRYVF